MIHVKTSKIEASNAATAERIVPVTYAHAVLSFILLGQLRARGFYTSNFLRKISGSPMVLF